MEALQSPQCDDFDDDANIATTTESSIIGHPSDGEEKGKKAPTTNRKGSGLKVRRAKIGPAFRSPNDARAFDLVGTFDLER